jgi:lipase
VSIWPRDQYVGLWKEGSFAAKRRNQWASPQEMFERFVGRAPFDRWDRDVLRDYCEYGLRPEDGRYVLACPPAIEASVYEQSLVPESDIYEEVAMVKAPVHVVRAGLEQDPANFMAQSPTPPDLASKFVRGRDTCLPQYSHFIPMEGPAFTAKLVEDMFALL